MVGFIKKLLGRDVSFDLSSELKDNIHNLVIKNLETYEENYHYAFKAVIEEWKEAKKDIDVPAIDKEAQNRASVETIKNEISILVNKKSEDDVEREIKAKTDNERTMTAALKTSEKIIAKLVSKSDSIYICHSM